MFTRIWLALVGQWSWDELPELPPEMVFLPKWFPLNKYDFGCWARQTIVPLTIVGSIKPVRPLPFTVDELRTGRTPAKSAKPWSWDGFFHGLDRVLHLYGRRPIRPLRELAKRRAAEWVLARQEIDGVLGRHPTAVGLLDPGAASARLPAGAPGAARWSRRPGRIHDPRGDAGRLGSPARSVPVAGVGHRAGH